jgi:hypothetical protein
VGDIEEESFGEVRPNESSKTHRQHWRRCTSKYRDSGSDILRYLSWLYNESFTTPSRTRLAIIRSPCRDMSGIATVKAPMIQHFPYIQTDRFHFDNISTRTKVTSGKTIHTNAFHIHDSYYTVPSRDSSVRPYYTYIFILFILPSFSSILPSCLRTRDPSHKNQSWLEVRIIIRFCHTGH